MKTPLFLHARGAQHVCSGMWFFLLPALSFVAGMFILAWLGLLLPKDILHTSNFPLPQIWTIRLNNSNKSAIFLVSGGEYLNTSKNYENVKFNWCREEPLYFIRRIILKLWGSTCFQGEKQHTIDKIYIQTTHRDKILVKVEMLEISML